MVTSRRGCRETALKALYQCDSIGNYSRETLTAFYIHFPPQTTLCDEEEEVSCTDTEFSRSITYGVVDNLLGVDTQIGLASTHWSVARMSRVDRNILRIAVFELMYLPEVPSKVAINEAIEIAKRFGSDESPNFINGVLDKVASVLVHSPRRESAQFQEPATERLKKAG